MKHGERDPATGARHLAELLQRALKHETELHGSEPSERVLAQKAGISPETVSNLLRGHLRGKPDHPWRPKPGAVRAIADALSVNQREALLVVGYDPALYLPPPAAQSEEMTDARLTQMIRGLSRDDKVLLWHLAGRLLRGPDTGDAHPVSHEVGVESHGETVSGGNQSHGEDEAGPAGSGPREPVA
jgi:hypothetical protein